MGHRLVTTLVALSCHVPRKAYYILHHHAGAKAVRSWRINYLLAFLAYPKLAFLTDFTREEAVKLFPPMRSRSSILLAPIDLHPLTTPEQRLDARARLGLPAQAWIIGNAGRQVPVKRFDVFLRTAARIAAARPDAHFVLGGDGPERGALQAFARELGLDGRITWLDWQGDMDRFYRALDVQLFNTEWDALGMIPLEALARGIPVVCSVAHGGLFEVLPWQNRYCFGEHDVEKLAHAALSLDAAESARQVAEGRALIAKHCDPGVITDRLLDLLGAAA